MNLKILDAGNPPDSKILGGFLILRGGIPPSCAHWFGVFKCMRALN